MQKYQKSILLLRRKVMLNESGILSDSIRYFHTPGPFASENLFSTERAGIYHCTKGYSFSRPRSDTGTCQLMLITEGELTLEYEHGHFCANAGCIIAMQLGEEQKYYTHSESLRMYWLHLDGPVIKAYIREINRINGVVFPVNGNPDIERYFRQILNQFPRGISDEHRYSILVHELLAALTFPLNQKKLHGIRNTIELAIIYMEEHYNDTNLSVEELAARYSVSKSYFIRKFKEYTGVSPHQYLLSVRIRMAKQLLDTTSESIENISEKCGFYSASHFIMYFRKVTGMTPLHFRMLWR